MFFTLLILLSIMQANICFCFRHQIQCIINFKNDVVKRPVGHVAQLASIHASPLQQEMNSFKDQHKEKFSSAVINNCYGGFGLSDFAMDLYCKRYKEKFGKEFKIEDEDGCVPGDDDIARDDPILVDLVKENPNKVDGDHASLRIVNYPRKYDGFFRFSEYDGTEIGYINVDAYKVRTIHDIITSALNADKKVQKISAVLDDPCEDADVRMPFEDDLSINDTLE